MKVKMLLYLTILSTLRLSANTPEPTSALAYQQTTNTRIVVEENYLRFFTGGSERMTIDGDGNVGVGTSEPEGGFHFASLQAQQNSVSDGIAFLKSTGNDYQIQLTSVGGIPHIDFSNVLHQDYDVRLGLYSNDRFSITGGNVGIGTTDPGDYRLKVSGASLTTGYIDLVNARPSNASLEGFYYYAGYNTSFQLVSSSWGASHSILFDAYKNATQVSGGMGAAANTKFRHGPGGYQGGAGAIQFSGNGGSFYFLISPPSTGAGDDIDWGLAKMMIKRNGSVGINTSDPDENYKLHVVGGIRATNYKSDVNSYADFVFEEDYELKSLEEVEKYIDTNHHLPDIPSEAEAKKNGVDLQEMQAKLLQKIEELTLYVIGQNKKIESLVFENQTQQKEIEKLKAIKE